MTPDEVTRAEKVILRDTLRDMIGTSANPTRFDELRQELVYRGPHSEAALYTVLGYLLAMGEIKKGVDERGDRSKGWHYYTID